MTKLLALFLLAYPAQAQTVQGVVLNSATKKPVAGAVVELTSAAGEGADADIYRALSDTAGRFRFDRVVPGRYRASANAQGFIRLGDHAPRVAVDPATPVPPVTLSLTPASVISGRVVDGDGDPLAYISVEALQYTYQTGKKALQTAGYARTDDRGEYRIFSLPPGRYYVRVTARASPTATNPVFFPASPDISGAAMLEATPGGELKSIDLMFHSVSVHSITGKAVDGQTGQIVSNVFVAARRNDDSYNGGGPQLKDSFTITNLVPGKYVLSAYEFSGGDTPKSGRVTVDLGNADLTGIVLTLNSLLEISGTVHELPDNPRQVRFSLEPDNPGLEAFGDTVSAKGTFTFHNVRPDLYRLAWNLPKGVYVKSIKLGDRLLKDDRLDLTGAAAPLAIQLGDDGGIVQGTVHDAEGKPVPGAVVTMATEPSYDFWSATADDAGHYEIRDLAPGEYRVLAFQDAPEGAPHDPDFRKPYEKSALRLQVLPSTQQKLDLTVVAQ